MDLPNCMGKLIDRTGASLLHSGLTDQTKETGFFTDIKGYEPIFS